MIQSACPACARKLEAAYILVETGAPQRKAQCPLCIQQRVAVLTQYNMTPRNRPRVRRPAGPKKKDTRARYRGPWRGEEPGLDD